MNLFVLGIFLQNKTSHRGDGRQKWNLKGFFSKSCLWHCSIVNWKYKVAENFKSFELLNTSNKRTFLLWSFILNPWVKNLPPIVLCSAKGGNKIAHLEYIWCHYDYIMEKINFSFPGKYIIYTTFYFSDTNSTHSSKPPVKKDQNYAYTPEQ